MSPLTKKNDSIVMHLDLSRDFKFPVIVCFKLPLVRNTILFGDGSPTATILYPYDVTRSLDILYASDGKANTYAESRVLV